MKNINKLKDSKGVTILNFVLILVIVIAFIIIGILAYNHMSLSEQNDKLEAAKLENNMTNDVANNNITGEVPNNVDKKELSKDDEIVMELNEKISFEPYILDELTSSKELNFVDKNNENYVKNDTILRMAFSKVDPQKFVNKNPEDVTAIVSYGVKETIVSDAIKNIFNNQIDYIKKDFIHTSSSEFNSYEHYSFIRYNETEDEYNFTQTMGGGGLTPFIEQTLYKAYKIDENTIELEMKIAFIDIGDNDTYDIYKEYNDGKYEELVDQKAGNYVLKEDREKLQSDLLELDLNTAVYTFKLDNTTNEYYLAEYKFN